MPADSTTTLATDASPAGDRGALHAEILGFFVNLAQAVKLPRSVGEIFGALYCSPRPLSFNELVGRSGTSKASVSQGLRVLKNLNAVAAVNVANDRRTYYRAEVRLRHLLEGFINEAIEPQLRRGAAQLARIENQLGGSHASERFLSGRVSELREWNRKASKLLPLFRSLDPAVETPGPAVPANAD